MLLINLNINFVDRAYNRFVELLYAGKINGQSVKLSTGLNLVLRKGIMQVSLIWFCDEVFRHGHTFLALVTRLCIRLNCGPRINGVGRNPGSLNPCLTYVRLIAGSQRNGINKEI
jgi:hypothetical protein